MSEEEKKKEDDGLEVTYHIPVQRFQYSDQLARSNKLLKKKNKRLKTLCVLLAIAGLLIGLFVPDIVARYMPSTLSGKKEEQDKIAIEMNLMENQWYFADQIDDPHTRFTDQALTGIAENEEDTHTAYMSAKEITDFAQSINQNFVGIGVQFTSMDDGLHMITRVFPDSPAEKAGVKAGDIIHSVNGTVVDGKSATEIQDLVKGEEGTDVTIVFVRDGEMITTNITRAQVAMTVEGDVKEDTGILKIEQFGGTTAQEVRRELNRFQEQGISKLIIDLRDDGGGYLDALQGVLGSFLPKDTVFLTRKYSDGRVIRGKTKDDPAENMGPVVILVNDGTASAAEAFTMAMKEQRNDVTVLGITTYGKGTVQITDYFDDGSALKFTDSIWESPDEVWVNGKGITPDVEVTLHPVLSRAYTAMPDDTTCAPDSVSEYVLMAQMCLDYLGYAPGRDDGYFSEGTLDALHAWQKAEGKEESDTLTPDLYQQLISDVVYDWNSCDEKDDQLNRAMELLKEKESAAIPCRSGTDTDRTGEEGGTDFVMYEENHTETVLRLAKERRIHGSL